MGPWHVDDAVTVWHGDCLTVLADMPDNSVDAVVTDPPYGLEFMGKDWDRFGTARDPRTAGRSGDGAINDSGITKTGYIDGGRRINRPAFGGTRPTTWRCDTCGKRNQFRNAHHATAPDCPGTWLQEIIDPDAPAPSFGYQQWCQQWATQCIRVLKPGGHMLAFGGTRTWHRLTVAIEDAGFEIRDTVADLTGVDGPALLWMYGSGFPKSLDVSKAIDRAAGAEREVLAVAGSDGVIRVPRLMNPGGGTTEALQVITAPATAEARQWQGWGTALKPSWEPIIVARKPLAGTVAGNVLAWGTGGLNIDATRVGMGDEYDPTKMQRQHAANDIYMGGARPGDVIPTYNAAGRWPPNAVLGDAAARQLDQQTGNTTSPTGPVKQGGRVINGGRYLDNADNPARDGTGIGYGDQGGGSRFFPVFRYEPKAPTNERPRTDDATAHPTVKPLDLIRWLVRMVTPPGGVILDPFAGSGTTGEAAIIEGFHAHLIEREADYLPMIRARLTKPIQPVLA